MRNVAVVVALVLALTGCSRQDEVDGGALLDELQDTLIDEGYLAHQLTYDQITYTVSVQAVLDKDKPAVVDAGWERAVDAIARIVWTKFRGEVGAVEVQIDLGGERTRTAEWLTENLGQRPDSFVVDDFPVALVVVVGALSLAAVGGLGWWLGNRRRSATTAEADAIPSPRD